MQSRTTRQFWRLSPPCHSMFNRTPNAPIGFSRAIRPIPACNSRNWKVRMTFIPFASDSATGRSRSERRIACFGTGSGATLTTTDWSELYEIRAPRHIQMREADRPAAAARRCRSGISRRVWNRQFPLHGGRRGEVQTPENIFLLQVRVVGVFHAPSAHSLAVATQ